MYRTTAPDKTRRNRVENVALISKCNKALVWISVECDEEGRMPMYLQYNNRIFAFDAGLEHCGERYKEIDVMIVKPDMVTRKRSVVNP